MAAYDCRARLNLPVYGHKACCRDSTKLGFGTHRQTENETERACCSESWPQKLAEGLLPSERSQHSVTGSWRKEPVRNLTFSLSPVFPAAQPSKDAHMHMPV